MKNLSSIRLSILIGLCILTACSATVTSTRRDLQVKMDQVETTQEFITEFGSTRVPPAGMKFMWIHIQLNNVGQIEIDTPQLENFSVLYAATELKPTYGHRQRNKVFCNFETKRPAPLKGLVSLSLVNWKT